MSQEKKRRTKVLLSTYENNDRWGDSYEDRIYHRRMDDGNLEMVAVKFFEGRRRVLDSVPDIQNADSFDAAFSRIDEYGNHYGYDDNLIRQVAKLDKKLAKEIRARFMEEEEGPEEILDKNEPDKGSKENDS